ncbi:MAG: polymer-forming cytoskeletal protein [Odoribacteraceae bacterium]|jgi:cytoskeletal protein CcmA (bactofilin family)|nr:polymer-forming cytoskeletal protein [Odoribacteraceae bacterium]
MSKEPSKENTRPVQTMILNDTEITGELIVTSGDLFLMGRINGNIRCSGHVEINEGARVSGNISCNALFLDGTVEGKVQTAMLVLREQGAVKGEIETTKLRIRGERAGERLNVSTLRLIHD